MKRWQTAKEIPQCLLSLFWHKHFPTHQFHFPLQLFQKLTEFKTSLMSTAKLAWVCSPNADNLLHPEGHPDTLLLICFLQMQQGKLWVARGVQLAPAGAAPGTAGRVNLETTGMTPQTSTVWETTLLIAFAETPTHVLQKRLLIHLCYSPSCCLYFPRCWQTRLPLSELPRIVIPPMLQIIKQM